MVGGGKISCSERPKSLCSGELWEGRRWTIEWRERKKTKERPEDSWKGSLISYRDGSASDLCPKRRDRDRDRDQV